MEQPLPRSIADLCQAQQTTFEQVKIPCMVCLQELDEKDLRSFDEGNFELVWTEEQTPRALCLCCRREVGFYQGKYEWQCSTWAQNAEKFLGCSLFCLSIRCWRCLATLTPGEKVLHLAGTKVHLIQHKWRGCCWTCSQT